MKIKIAIAEDNALLAQSIKEKLELFRDAIFFKFKASNGQHLIELLKNDNNVDVILMDIEMPIMDGIKATEIVKDNYPQIKIIILTVFDDEDKIFRAIQAGANGYLLKDEPPNIILEGIKDIVSGGAPMSPTIATKAIELLRNPEKRKPNKYFENFSLSKRETEVLEQLSKGLNYKNIAVNLFISPSTVRKHIENIYKKLHVSNKMKAVLKAQKHNLI
ncbi:MAG: response regulator transcription factor [Melioribacteraceae bacterium]